MWVRDNYNKENEMEKDLVSGDIGSVAKYDVAFKSGALCAELDFAKSGCSAGLIVKIDAEAIIAAIKAAIPGHFEDAVLDAAVALLKA